MGQVSSAAFPAGSARVPLMGSHPLAPMRTSHSRCLPSITLPIRVSLQERKEPRRMLRDPSPVMSLQGNKSHPNTGGEAGGVACPPAPSPTGQPEPGPTAEGGSDGTTLLARDAAWVPIGARLGAHHHSFQDGCRPAPYHLPGDGPQGVAQEGPSGKRAAGGGEGEGVVLEADFGARAGHEPESGRRRRWDGQGSGSPPEPPEGAQPCPHLQVPPVRPLGMLDLHAGDGSALALTASRRVCGHWVQQL